MLLSRYGAGAEIILEMPIDESLDYLADLIDIINGKQPTEKSTKTSEEIRARSERVKNKPYRVVKT